VSILVDSSVWSLALRRQKTVQLNREETRLTALLADAITDGSIVMIGPIRQELLSAIKEEAQFQKLKAALDAYRDEGLETKDFEEAARLYNLCRSRGMECGPFDILMCAVAWLRGWKVLTNDVSMTRCLEVIKGLPGLSTVPPTALP
jgi:predicted nucleic acid-binding protein